MRILLIEDNIRLVERVKRYLGKNFIVDAAHNGQEGKKKALNNSYGAIVLDLNLPDGHGGDICQELRENNITTPILILSGIEDTSSKIALLNSGADDYLVKPFNPGELIARIHALSRRREHGYGQHIITVRDLTIDVNRRRVQRAGQDIPLRRKEFDILEYLVSNQGRAVTREMILNNAWDDAKTGWQNTINVHIKHLRDKVDKPFDSPLIKTAYGVGYMVDNTTG